jgi:HK97 family phage prohead protease
MGKRTPIEDRVVLERRVVPASDFELEMETRADGGTSPKLVGHASVFDQETTILGLWREKVARGAFAKTIKEQDIRALFNHDPNVVLGRKSAGTLDLSEDAKGLATVIRPPDNEWGRPVVDAIKRGDVSGMSISFRIVRQEWRFPDEAERAAGVLPSRTILEAKLYDVGPVTFPAFEQTSISARSGDGGAVLDVPDEARRLLAAQGGASLTPEARAIVEAAREILASSQPTAGPAPDHPDDERKAEPARGHSVPMLRRRLELAARTVY